MRRVLRLGPGDAVAAFDGSGLEYLVRLEQVGDQQASGPIAAQRELQTEPRLTIALAQALLPREKLETVLQKSTEVGVSSFLLVASERSLPRAESVDADRLERWQRIVREAAEQSGRAREPAIVAPLSLAESLERAGPAPVLLAWERERRRSTREAFARVEPAARQHGLVLLIGPEGGFGPDEAALVEARGGLTVSLGPRILRAETAGPVFAALALSWFGDLEPPG
jgi:16S rRNA (uracil1498-N3)-methyltransferase